MFPHSVIPLWLAAVVIIAIPLLLAWAQKAKPK